VTESPLVAKAQVRAAVGEREAGTHVRGQRAVRITDQHLAAHAEVRQQRLVVIECEPEVLTAAFGVLDRASRQGSREPVRARRVAAHGARMEHLGGGNGTSGHVELQALADGLYLGQFRHEGTCSRR
jgi:hypothetical protein